MFEKMKIKVKKFLDAITKENKNTFGNKKMDCCNLNKAKNKKK